MKIKPIIGSGVLALILTGCATGGSDIGAGRTYPLQVKVVEARPNSASENDTVTVYALTENLWGESGKDIANVDDCTKYLNSSKFNKMVAHIGETITIDTLPYREVVIVEYATNKLIAAHNIDPTTGSLVTINLQ